MKEDPIQKSFKDLFEENRQMRRALKEWAMLWAGIDEYLRNHPEMKLGESISEKCLKFLKERDMLKQKHNN